MLTGSSSAMSARYWQSAAMTKGLAAALTERSTARLRSADRNARPCGRARREGAGRAPGVRGAHACGRAGRRRRGAADAEASGACNGVPARGWQRQREPPLTAR